MFASVNTIAVDRMLKLFSDCYSDIPVFGGVAGDNMQYGNQFVFTDKGICKGIAVALFHGDSLNIYTDYHLNWRPIGKEFTVTGVKGNILTEIDGQPALDVYRKYMGDVVINNQPLAGMEFPLIFKKSGIDVARVVSSITAQRELELAGSVEFGDNFRFSYGHIEDIIGKGTEVVDFIKNKPTEVFWLFSCTARLSFMQDAAQAELNLFKKLPPSSGFFTYGEFFSNGKLGNQLLNTTLTMVVLSENEKIIPTSQITEAYNEITEYSNTRNSLIFQALNNLTSTVTEELNQTTMNYNLLLNNCKTEMP